ncbi:hypothetical protein POTOM_057454 [Populus tomentosa]|uniref:Uncharacterized protein n=1 Tax=Populus tomentosa TaxID=118781 RepID=A0A8X8C4Z0_POPTO|nr:hypothetical protein POTOM_057454 [Populus tomentosa]
MCKTMQISRYLSNPRYQYVMNKLKVILFPFLHNVMRAQLLKYQLSFIQFPSITLRFDFSSSRDIEREQLRRWVLSSLTSLQFMILMHRIYTFSIDGVWYLPSPGWLHSGHRWEVSFKLHAYSYS